MNIIFMNWACFCAEDTCLALRNLGHKVQVMQITEEAHTIIDEKLADNLCTAIQSFHCDLVFSLNYFPTISVACQKSHCKYVSWIYDCPQTKVYDATASNDCNRIFTFDSHMADLLNQRGVNTITYAPLAANVKRLTSTAITAAHKQKYTCDISFVGSLYNEDHNFYERLLAKSQSPYLEGYLNGIIQAQKHVFGYNFLSECLTPEITEAIRKVMPYTLTKDSNIREEEVYADYYLARRLATIDRMELLYCLGEFFNVNLYTTSDASIGKVKNCGKLHYYEEMPYLFRLSNINLNISLRSIKNGIPLRAMDILGCGGFLMSNFQSDLLRHFEPEVHFTAYSSVSEAVDKCNYYLTHEEERRKIASNALTLMQNEHTYEIRLQQMLSD